MIDSREIIDAIDANVHFSFSRSAGAGGQNVNKVNTKVTARLALSALPGLDERQAGLLETRLRGRLNSAGEVVVHVQEERSQSRNREIATQRLRALILHALTEKKHRRPTQPSKSARRARLEAKRRRSLTKSHRRRVEPRDEA